jgi:hypothetical protein
VGGTLNRCECVSRSIIKQLMLENLMLVVSS